jgi:hypothetical protein
MPEQESVVKSRSQKVSARRGGNFSDPIFLPQNASFHSGLERQKNGVRKIFFRRENSDGG